MSPVVPLTVVIVLCGFVIIFLGFLVSRKSKVTIHPGQELISSQKLNEMLTAAEQLTAEHQELQRKYAQQEVTLRAEYDAQMREYRHQVDLTAAENKRSEAKKTAARSRVALVAKIGEHFAPLLQGFPYNFKDVRHVGEIFDFLVFDGLEDGEIRNVVFLEVKTKQSGGRVRNPRERMLRDAIEANRVKYEIFVPEVGDAKNG